MSLHTKVLIVTGATGPIGLATAKIAAGEGARVMLVATASDRLEQARKTVAEIGQEVEAFAADCSKWEQVGAYVSATLKRFGRVDALFNNAGIEGKVAALAEYPEDEWDRVVGLDLKGVFLGLRHVLPVMITQGSGAIVNTGSLSSERGGPGAPAYAAAKHGLVGLTRQAASEAARYGIRVNAVMPGFVDSAMLRRALSQILPQTDIEEGVRRIGSTVPMGRCATPEEIGHVVAFLLSDRASYVNGVNIAVDGGYLSTLRL